MTSQIRLLKRVRPAALALDEPPIEKGVLVSDSDAERYETVLLLVSSGANPSTRRRSYMHSELRHHVRRSLLRVVGAPAWGHLR